MDENNLVKKCQDGDKDAFQELIRKFHPLAYRFAIRLTENEQLAEDLTQDTFLKIIRSIEKFDINGSAKFSTYIITVCKNSYIDYLRREKRFVKPIPIDEGLNTHEISSNFEDIVIDRIDNIGAIKQLDNLTEEQKAVIKLKYIEGLTLKEIGEILEIEPKTVKSRIHNGMVKLKKVFERGEGYE